MKRPTKQEREQAVEAVEEDTPDDSGTVDMSGEIPVIRWSNRRKMAWRAFTVLVVYTGAYWFILPLWFQWWGLPTTWLDIIAESFFWFATTMATVIVAYMGFTSLPFMGRGRDSGQKGQKYDVSDEDF